MNKLVLENIIAMAKICMCQDGCNDCDYRNYDDCRRHLVLDLLSVINYQNNQIKELKEDYLYVRADYEAIKNMVDTVASEGKNK